MKVYSADMRNATAEEIEKMIKDFTDAGWELAGGFYHGANNFHKFIQFIWNHESEAVAPAGYRVD